MVESSVSVSVKLSSERHSVITYPDPDIPASCRRGHCRIKMVDGTDNQKKVEDTENKTALSSTRYM